MGAVLETSEEEFSKLLHGNLSTVFIAARESLRALMATRGTFVAVSSLAALEAVPLHCGYTTAKHATIGLIRSIACDYGPFGVRANAVCPGWVKTPLADGAMKVLMEREGCSIDEAYDIACSETPLGHAINPDEVARLCVFLGSEDSAGITGALVPIDAGAAVVCAPMLKVYPQRQIAVLRDAVHRNRTNLPPALSAPE